MVSQLPLLPSLVALNSRAAAAASSLNPANDKEGSKLGLRIFPSAMHKCPRCWVYSSPREEMLCVRCEGVVRELEERSSDLP